ncbi:hypothetical protein C8F01DRAFT_1184241 [Mycena amicta]|nr:hypothetical protein C8F01DRAFT_1192608 [Mycena amicta]KAJ7049230.1 hypothetical protein C8F01DRAFT_1184241 [Mycena amicta]
MPGLKSSHSLCAHCTLDCFESSSMLPTATETARLSTLLRTNVRPATADFAEFRRRAKDGALEIRRYDAAIADLEALLEKLEAERAALEVYVDGCATLGGSYIHQLPGEILAEIMCQAGPVMPESEGEAAQFGRRDRASFGKRYLLDLASVSSLWHQVAMNTAFLWSEIIVDFRLWAGDGALADEQLSNALKFFEATLKRTGNHLLLLRIVDVKLPPAASLLVAQAHRWRDVAIWDSIEQFSSASGRLCALEKLLLQTSTSTRSSDVFSNVPHLRELVLTGSPGFIPQQLPWNQLRSVTFFQPHMHLDHVMAFPVHELPPLSHLILKSDGLCCRYDHSVLRVAKTSRISQLSLQLSLDRLWNPTCSPALQTLGALLSCFTLPHLDALTVGVPIRSRLMLWNQRAFMALVERSAFYSTLRRLELFAVIQERELLGVVESLPLLQHLHVMDVELIQLLEARSAAFRVCASDATFTLQLVCLRDSRHKLGVDFWERVAGIEGVVVRV